MFRKIQSLGDSIPVFAWFFPNVRLQQISTSDDILVSDLHISTIFRLTLGAGAEAMAGIEISKAAEVGVEAGSVCREWGNGMIVNVVLDL